MAARGNLARIRYRYVQGTATPEGAQFHRCAISLWSLFGRLAGERYWTYHDTTFLPVKDIELMFNEGKNPEAEFCDERNGLDAEQALVDIFPLRRHL